MTIWDFMDNHPVWACIYLMIVASIVPSIRLVYRLGKARE